MRERCYIGGGAGKPTFGKFLQGHPEPVGHGPDFVLPVRGPQGFHMWGDSSKGPFLKHLPVPAPPPPPHLNPVRQVRGKEVKTLVLGLLGFNCFQLKIICTFQGQGQPQNTPPELLNS